MRCTVCFCILALLLHIPTFAQLEANYWFFNEEFGVKFTPNLNTSLKGIQHTHEECVSFSNRNTGELLFYTGVDEPNRHSSFNIYNRLHQVLASNLRGSCISSQGLLTIPNPANCKQFYLLSLDAKDANSMDEKTQISYNIIDMQMNIGLGSVIVQNRIAAIDWFTEGLTGTLHGNGRDYWIIVYRYQPKQGFIVIPVSSAGIDIGKSVFSPANIFRRDNYNNVTYSMVMSPDGSKIIVCYNKSTILLYDFDKVTGSITNEADLGLLKINGADSILGQLQIDPFPRPAFSSDNSKLYFSAPGNKIGQIDFTVNPAVVNILSYSLEEGIYVGGFQNAPDNKIYFLIKTSDALPSPHPVWLGCINFPDLPGNKCEIRSKVVLINQEEIHGGGLQLPNYMDYIFDRNYRPWETPCAIPKAAAQPDTTCEGGTLLFADHSLGTITKRQWIFTGGTPTTSADSAVRVRYDKRGTYPVKLIACNGNGCDTVFTTAVVLPPPSVAAFGDTSLCSGGNAPLKAAGAVSYIWTPATGLDNPTSATPIATPSVTTRYVVQGTDPRGCVGYDSVLVAVGELVVQISPDTVICEGKTIGLWALGGERYQWTPPDGLNDPRSPSPVATPLQTTTYRVEVRAGACVGTDSVTVSVLPAITATASSDTTICAGGSVGLWATGGVQYQWEPTEGLDDPRSPNPVARPAMTTTYRVTATNAAGCSDVDSVTITVLPGVSLTVTADTSICQGKSVRLSVVGGEQYLWSPPDGLDNPNSPTPIATPAKTTTYRVTATKAGSCPGIDSITVAVLPAVVATAAPDTTLCVGESVELWATGGEQYLWSPADGLDDPRSSNPVARPAQTTTYRVTVTNVSGCSGVDSVTVQVNAGTVRRVEVITPTQKVKPGSITDVHLSVEAGISAIAGQLLYDGAGLKLTGVPTISNGWNLTATETGYGITDITAQGAPTGADITLPMTVYLPPDARDSETLIFTPRHIETAMCDTTETIPAQLYYDPTCAWKLRTVVGSGKAYSVMVQGESVVYSIGLAGSVRVVLYDNLGQRIATLSDGYHAAGEYRVRLPDVAAGMYAARLETPLGAWSALLSKGW